MGRPLVPRCQPLRQIITLLPRNWGLSGVVNGRIVERRRFQFIFPSEESMLTVMRRGPWAFADRIIVLQRWNPDMDESLLNFIPFWVQFRGIPLQYLTRTMIKTMAEKFGEVLKANLQPM